MVQNTSIIITKLNKVNEKPSILTIIDRLFITVFLTAGFLGFFLEMIGYEFIGGGKYFLNQISKMLGKSYGKIFPTYDLSGNSNAEQFSSLIFIILLFVGVATIFYLIVTYENIVLNILMIFCVIFLQVTYGNQNEIFFFTLFVMGSFLNIRRSSFQKDWRAGNKAVRQLMIVFLILAIILGFSMTEIGDKNIGVVHTIHHIVEKMVEQIRYEKKGDVALEVTMSEPASYYLKGFIGSSLGCDGWEETEPSKRYQYADLFYWLHKENFYGENQLATAAKNFNPTTEKENVNELHIKNVGVSAKYIYLPYEYLEDEEDLLDKNQIGDESAKARGLKGNREYSVKAVSNQVSKYPEILKNISNVQTKPQEQYISQESFYNEYVYDMYKNLTREDSKLLENHLGAYSRGSDAHMEYQRAKTNILQFLSKNIKYTEQSKKKKIGQDFLKDFLEISCEGGDDDYATATVLMFWYYGIPARYVEGYLITPEDIDGVGRNETIKIPQDNRHCWAEYYQDGVGWIPFETAPPYLNVMEQAKGLHAISSNREKEQPQKEVIEKDNYEESNEKTIPEEKEEVSMKWILIGIILLLVALPMLYLLRRFYIRRKRSENFETTDYNAAIRALFSYGMKLFFMVQKEQQNKSLMEYENEIAIYESSSDRISYQQAVAIYQKARFGKEACTKKEREEVRNYVMTLKTNIYQSLKLGQKIKWKVMDY